MKLKTHKGVAKRFKLTKKKKIKYSHGGKSHLLSSKNRKRKRKLRQSAYIAGKKDKKHLTRMLPYS